MKKMFVLVVGMMFLAGCAATTATQKSGFLGEYYNNLKPGQGEGEAKLVWIKPGVNFTKYKKVMVDYVIFALAEDSEYKGIDASELKKIADAASLALVDALKKEFPVVAEPGPDVIRVRTAIVDLKQSSPVLSGVTTVLPVGLAISLVKKGTTDSWTGSGVTTAEMMVLDSVSNEVLAAGHDQKAAGFTERFTAWGSVEEAFKFWGERFTKNLVALVRK
jgi:hypothetical protein